MEDVPYKDVTAETKLKEEIENTPKEAINIDAPSKQPQAKVQSKPDCFSDL